VASDAAESPKALSRHIMRSRIDTLAEAVRAPDGRAVGPRPAGQVASSGHALDAVRAAVPHAQPEPLAVASELGPQLQRHPQPVIAQVQGVATAAGCQLVASCDLAVAAASARFATPGVRIGLFCSTPMVALSRSVPAKTAMRMLLTGDFLASDQALNFGLVSDVVDDDELEDATEALAHRVASVSSATVAIGKSAFYEQRELPVDEAYERMSQVTAHDAVTVDAQGGIDAFLSKREPRWRHRGADAGA